MFLIFIPNRFHSFLPFEFRETRKLFDRPCPARCPAMPFAFACVSFDGTVPRVRHGGRVLLSATNNEREGGTWNVETERAETRAMRCQDANNANKKQTKRMISGELEMSLLPTGEGCNLIDSLGV